MEKMKSSFYRIGEQPKPFITTAQKEISDFFDHLPYFQPWVWKLIAALGIIGFFVGLGIGIWACYPLEK